MRTGNHRQIELRGRRVDFRLVTSRSARRLWLRVGLHGIEVVQPVGRSGHDVSSFLDQNEEWILNQLERVERLRKKRVERLRKIRVPDRQGEVLFRGERTHIRIEGTAARSRGNLVRLVDGEIVVQRPSGTQTPLARSLESWLRRQARAEIEK